MIKNKLTIFTHKMNKMNTQSMVESISDINSNVETVKMYIHIASKITHFMTVNL